MLTQLTIRGFDAELELKIRQLARRDGLSLNKAVLRLLRKGAGIASSADDVERIGTGLDEFIGTWSESRADAVNDATGDFGQIDESLWR